MNKKISILFSVIRYISIVSFFSFAISSITLGGDAHRGQIKDGLYYLGTRGRFTEVSKTIYLFSWYHTIFTFIFFALAFISMAICKPEPIESKWQGRLILVGIVTCAFLSFVVFK